MASTCISNCVNDARGPVRANYVNLYKWPESDAEFIRSVSSKNNGHGHVHGHGRGRGHGQGSGPKVVDSISCRQLYLRSYTFSREEENVSDEKKVHVKCYGKTKRKLARRTRRRKCKVFRKAKELSCAALASIFQRLLSCTTKVDVVG